MDLLSDYRITTLFERERDLALRAERARVALERAQRPAERLVTATGSLMCIPSPAH